MKKIGFLCIVLIVVLTGCSVKSGTEEVKGKTIEEAFLKSERLQNAEIIYKENIDQGSLVFFIPGSHTDSVQTSKLGVKYLWRISGGWAASYFRGEYGSQSQDKIAFEYIPAMKGSPFPIYYGEILDSSIKRVIIFDERNDEKIEGKIITLGKIPTLQREVRLWYSLTDVAPSSSTKVIGLDDANRDFVIYETIHPAASTTIVN